MAKSMATSKPTRKQRRLKSNVKADSSGIDRFYQDETEPQQTLGQLDVDELYDNRSILNQNQAAGNTGGQQDTNPSGTVIPNYASDVTPILPDNSNNDARFYMVGGDGAGSSSPDTFPTLHHQVESTDIAVNPDHFLPLTSQTVISSPNAALDSGSNVANPAFMYAASSEKDISEKDIKKDVSEKDISEKVSVTNAKILRIATDNDPDPDNTDINAALNINVTNPHAHIPSMVGVNIEHIIDAPPVDRDGASLSSSSADTYYTDYDNDGDEFNDNDNDNDYNNQRRIQDYEDRDINLSLQETMTNPLNLPLREQHEQGRVNDDRRQALLDDDLVDSDDNDHNDANGTVTDIIINTQKVLPDSHLPSTPESLYEAALYGNAALQALKLYKGLRPEDVGIVTVTDFDTVTDPVTDPVISHKAETTPTSIEFKPNPFPTPATTPISQQNQKPRQAFVAQGQDQIPPENRVVDDQSALVNSRPLISGGDTIDYRVEEGGEAISDESVIIGREVSPPASHYEDDMYSTPSDLNVKGWMSFLMKDSTMTSMTDDRINDSININRQHQQSVSSSTAPSSSFIQSPYRDFGTNPAVIPFDETLLNKSANLSADAINAQLVNGSTNKSTNRSNDNFAPPISQRQSINLTKPLTLTPSSLSSLSRAAKLAPDAWLTSIEDNIADTDINTNANINNTKGYKTMNVPNKAITNDPVMDAINASMEDEAHNAYYTDPSIPAGANTNVHAEPVSEFIAAFNELAVDTMRSTYSNINDGLIPKILDPRYEQTLPEYEMVTPERLSAIISIGEQALQEHRHSLSIQKPSSMDIDQYNEFVVSNRDIVEAIDQTLNYLMDAAEVVETAYQYDSYMLPVVNDVDDDPSLDADVANIVTLNANFYQSLYYASLFLQRSGDRFDQFVVNMKRPSDRFVDNVDGTDPVTVADNIIDPVIEFDEDWNYVLTVDDADVDDVDSEFNDTDSSTSDITDRLLTLANQAVPLDKVSYPFAKAGSGSMYALYKTATKNALSLRQTLAAFNKVYSRVMSAGGGWLYATPLVSGVSRQELDALAEEGLIRYDTSGASQRFTLTRTGYERPQWLDLSAGVKPAGNMTGSGTGNVRF